jgi:ribosomal small subunit protein bTHX
MLPFESLTGGTNMGKGDIRTRRGKTCRGTYGNTRPKRKKVKAKEKVTVQVATKAPQLNKKEIAFNGVNQDPPASPARPGPVRAGEADLGESPNSGTRKRAGRKALQKNSSSKRVSKG